MKILLRAVLFLDALLQLLLGILLLASPFATLYAALQLPQPQPALYGQLLGVAMIGFAWLLVQATINGQLTVAIARTVGQVNLIGAILIVSWVLFLEVPVQGAGKIWLLTLAAVLAFFAAVQIPAAKRVRRREREAQLAREAERQAATTATTGGRPVGPGGDAVRPDPYPHDDAVRPASREYPEYRREPVITPPPGYGPGTEVLPDPATEELPSPHHARQNPHS
ncbi:MULTISPECIES: hypothetical protein [Cupriavidus]|jgi:hypothetical protein|uniref:Transmembrane protein n=1 Tax=Cupriavidus pauculus TaxID=82633 RepID=A0A5P2H1X4_9BURK|nr:hypothetical protein [Cupriavidus pauculus]QET01901.1 hypothetical protein FOB72_07495 [Cupriavidus pauculus]